MREFVNPLCDRDHCIMSQGGVVAVPNGMTEVRPAYLCGHRGCHLVITLHGGILITLVARSTFPTDNSFVRLTRTRCT